MLYFSSMILDSLANSSASAVMENLRCPLLKSSPRVEIVEYAKVYLPESQRTLDLDHWQKCLCLQDQLANLFACSNLLGL
mmetsp:Transcript_9845/g.32931  ORF Transcript_9845/g.32931 Transcript_9845/m.32931 type:complete len:80 (-) Transcript_9845:1707-1946(-)